MKLIVWFKTEGQGNWGGWGNYPDLPVSASYLQYDSNQCQVNLTPGIEIGNELFNCISNSRPVGSKWSNRIRFNDLQELFQITNSEIETKIKEEENAKQLKYLESQLSIQTRFLNEQDDYAPFMVSIEKIFKKSERSEETFVAPIGQIIFGHSSNEDLVIANEVEWKQVRMQGKNGPNKKRVFVPASIPADVQKLINETIDDLRFARIEELKKRVLELTKKIYSLKNG